MIDLKFQRNSNQTSDGSQQYFYTKENITVNHNLQNSVVSFRFLNTINISKLYENVQNTLLKLKIIPKMVHLMGFDCETMVHDVGNPKDHLTALITDSSKQQIKKSLNIIPAVVSLILVNNDPKDEDVQIRIAPLASNPNESFYVHISYKTRQHKRFDNFIREFEENKIENIIKGMCK